MLLYIIAAEVLANFIDADKRIQGIQIGDHEIKIGNFAEDTSIVLKASTCLHRIQVILKLYVDGSSSKMNFLKRQPLWAGTFNNRTDQPGQIEWSQLILVNSTFDNSSWDKISEGIIKKIHIGNSFGPVKRYS